MKNEKQTSNLNFNVQLFWKLKNHLFWCFLSQLQYRNENQNFLSNFIFQFIKKTKRHFRYTDLNVLKEIEKALVFLFIITSRFPKSKLLSGIIRDRYGNYVLKFIRKFEKLDFRLRKIRVDIEFLNSCLKNALCE